MMNSPVTRLGYRVVEEKHGGSATVQWNGATAPGYSDGKY
jgi:hypothetical protein